ncbi:hypothetical protein FRC12_000061 [Ceratobasidium sp. 428]|nr:hypothetical protein FRC12_000061 [Ceratobasidium sp. 428]
MSSTLDEGSQLAPSQFAYFKPTQPTTTASGITPGRALLDSPSPNHTPSPPLERSHRTRKPTTRKLEAVANETQPNTSKSQPKKRTQTSTGKQNGKNVRKTSNVNTSKSATVSGSQAGATQPPNQSGTGVEAETQGGFDSQGEGDDAEGEYETLVNELESTLGHSVENLSTQQIKTLHDQVRQTQALALGPQIQPATTVTQSTAGLGLASGDRSGSHSYEDSGERSQKSKTTMSSEGPLSAQKRRLDAPAVDAASKRARIATDRDDAATEPDSDSDDHSSSSSDSDSEREDASPSKPQGSTSKPTLAGRGPAPSARMSVPAPSAPPARSHAPAPARPLVNAPAPPEASTPAAASLARHPPPTNLNDNEALINWALRIVAEQAQGVTPGSSTSNLRPRSQLDRPTTTTTSAYIAQAVANHRAEHAATGHPRSQADPDRSSSAATTIARTSRASTPAPASEETTTPTSGAGKRKYRKKTKLADFPGCIGEIASAAIPYFLATVFAEGGYEGLETFEDWALDAYRRTYHLEYPDEPEGYERPPVAVLKIMARRASWLRGEIKKRVRAVVEYGYGFRHNAVSRVDIKHNRRLSKILKPNVFHCRNLVSDTDQFEHPEFIHAISAGLFWDSESLGAVFQNRFKPVPMPAVALILTIMQFCIEEWREGHYKPASLDIDTQKDVYGRHLLGLYEYERIAASRLTRFRTEWATAGLDYSGATLDDDSATVQPYVLAANVRPDTPPPELNNENFDAEEHENEGSNSNDEV